jgi:hypothetical protein
MLELPKLIPEDGTSKVVDGKKLAEVPGSSVPGPDIAGSSEVAKVGDGDSQKEQESKSLFLDSLIDH